MRKVLQFRKYNLIRLFMFANQSHGYGRLKRNVEEIDG